MIHLTFIGGNEYFEFEIDRKNKRLKIASSKTNYGLTQVKWNMLFDKGKEKIQDNILEKYDNKTFIDAIIVSMATQGYEIIKRDE